MLRSKLNAANRRKLSKTFRRTTQYELGSPLPQFEVGGSLYPVYVRGEVYLLLHKGKEAAAEFQKFLDHRGVALNSPLGASGTPSTRPRLCTTGRYRPDPEPPIKISSDCGETPILTFRFS